MSVRSSQDENIPVDVFDYTGSGGQDTGDFFMGLSDEIDPTKDLPPVDVGMNVPEDLTSVEQRAPAIVDKGKRPVSGVPSSDASQPRVGPWVSPVLNTVDGSDIGNVPSTEAFSTEVCSSEKMSPGAGGVKGNTRTGVRLRPKKLVPSRNLGLATRDQVRRQNQIVHTSSSEDDYEEDPESGEKRKRVGFLFRTAPHPLLPNFLTDDDQWKLEGCPLHKRVKRVERVAGLVVFTCFSLYN